MKKVNNYQRAKFKSKNSHQIKQFNIFHLKVKVKLNFKKD